MPIVASFIFICDGCERIEDYDTRDVAYGCAIGPANLPPDWYNTGSRIFCGECMKKKDPSGE